MVRRLDLVWRKGGSVDLHARQGTIGFQDRDRGRPAYPSVVGTSGEIRTLTALFLRQVTPTYWSTLARRLVRMVGLEPTLSGV